MQKIIWNMGQMSEEEMAKELEVPLERDNVGTRYREARQIMAKNMCISIFMATPEYENYNYSWDLLHPVVEKLFSLSTEQLSPLYLADLQLSWSRRNLEEVFNSVVKCIEKYNENLQS